MRKSSLIWVLLWLLALPAWAGWDEGVAAFKAGDFKAAEQQFRGVVKQSPDGYQSHYMLGLSLQRINRKEEALASLRKAYDLNPNDLPVKMALGQSYRAMRRFGDAAQLLAKIDASTVPSNQRQQFYQMRAEAYFRSNNMPRALADFKQRAALLPNDAQAQYTYGSTALSQGQSSAGLAALKKANSLAPSDSKIAKIYVKGLIKQGQVPGDKASKKRFYMQAASIAKKLAAASPTYDHLMLQLSAELGAGLYGRAAETGKVAISKNGADWLPHYYVGQAFTSIGQFSEALTPLQTALAKVGSTKDKNRVYLQLGYMFSKQKDYAKSIEAYNRGGHGERAAKVLEIQETDKYNSKVEEENKVIQEMKAEAARLEAEMAALEGGGGR